MINCKYLQKPKREMGLQDNTTIHNYSSLINTRIVLEYYLNTQYRTVLYTHNLILFSIE